MGCECEKPAVVVDIGEVRVINIEFLFLDEEVCTPCGGTSVALKDAVALTGPVLESMGITVQIARKHMATKELAIAERLLTSPTIRIAGADIEKDFTEADCGTCSTLTGDETSVVCRTWHWLGNESNAAPVGQIVEAIMVAATSPLTTGSEIADYTLPSNLARFFDTRGQNLPLCC